MSLTYMVAGGPGSATPPAWRVCTELAYYAALAIAAGMFLTVGFLLPRRPQVEPIAAVLRAPAVPVAVLGLVAGYLEAAAGVARTKLGYSFTEALWPPHLLEYARTAPDGTKWISGGAVVLVQLAAFALIAVLLVAGVRRGPTRVLPAVGLAVVLTTAAFPALTASPVTFAAAAGAVVKAVHIIAALIWVGGLFVLAAAGLRARRIGADGAGAWEHVWRRFSVWALGAVIAVSVSGLWEAWVHVGTPAEFVTTSYGRFLLVKLVLVAAMVTAGAYNVRVLIPALRRARLAGDEAGYVELAVRRFPRVVLAEAVAALGVLSIVPFLSDSARKQEGHAPAGAFDATTLAIGVVLVLALALGAAVVLRSGRDGSARDGIADEATAPIGQEDSARAGGPASEPATSVV